MKYFLAFDKGVVDKNKRMLDLKELEQEFNYNLMSDNNLQKLCTFTMSFQNEDSLKYFLKVKHIIKEEDFKQNLVIAYSRNNLVRTMKVPYKFNEKYFDREFLVSRIRANANKDKDFLKDFLKTFQEVRYYSDNYYLLREATEIYMTDYMLLERIKNFVDSYCYRNKKFYYRKLYFLAMYVSKNDLLESKRVSNSLWDMNLETLSDAQRFKLEEWISNAKKRSLTKK